MQEQLIKKNCTSGAYENIYPITSLSSVVDTDTGETLDKVLEKYNHIYLPFKDNSKTFTRQQVPANLRRQGLWITYISCKGNTITEWYDNDDFSDKAWGDSKNWVPYMNKEVIKSMIDDILSWYKT